MPTKNDALTFELNPHYIYSPRQAKQITSLNVTTQWRMRQRGEFPSPIRLSPGRVGYKGSDLIEWIETRKRG